jgi:hypothetical protein
MGPAATLAGVFIRTGSVVASTGERVVSGLVQRLRALKFASDNAGCFGTRPFSRNGRFITFGAHEVYVGTESVHRYVGTESIHRDLCEYDATQGFTLVTNRRSRVEEVKTRGRDLNIKLERDIMSIANNAASFRAHSDILHSAQILPLSERVDGAKRFRTGP